MKYYHLLQINSHLQGVLYKIWRIAMVSVDIFLSVYYTRSKVGR